MKYVVRLVDTTLGIKTLAHACGTEQAAEDHAEHLNEILGDFFSPWFRYEVEPARECLCAGRDRVPTDGECWRCGGSVE